MKVDTARVILEIITILNLSFVSWALYYTYKHSEEAIDTIEFTDLVVELYSSVIAVTFALGMVLGVLNQNAFIVAIAGILISYVADDARRKRSWYVNERDKIAGKSLTTDDVPKHVGKDKNKASNVSKNGKNKDTKNAENTKTNKKDMSGGKEQPAHDSSNSDEFERHTHHK